ncbi:MAG: hypothetical protein ACI8ZN_000625 [Bacteroidia bacterium]|jgi:hypothetical protein
MPDLFYAANSRRQIVPSFCEHPVHSSPMELLSILSAIRHYDCNHFSISQKNKDICTINKFV